MFSPDHLIFVQNEMKDGGTLKSIKLSSCSTRKWMRSQRGNWLGKLAIYLLQYPLNRNNFLAMVWTRGKLKHLAIMARGISYGWSIFIIVARNR